MVNKIIINLMLALSLNLFDVNALNSTSAVMIDASSGRILVGKNENEILPNASTTKILTCILALENCEMDEVVTVSEYASKMPDVQLDMRKGQRFRLGDLMYSLMLESHNDTAVAIAEHVSGSVDKFAELMNEKAREIGCFNTNFVTPNGLDGKNENGIHGSTAYDLALLMKYCVNNEKFIEITSESSYSFSDLDGETTYTVNNKNVLLKDDIGVISGKTGYTSKAGYCYVCACKEGDRMFIVSLLGCGWPPGKNKKWVDCKSLLRFGKANYDLLEYKNIEIDKKKLLDIPVENGTKAYVSIKLDSVGEGGILLNANENLELVYNIPKIVYAPVKKGDVLGEIQYKFNNKTYYTVLVQSDTEVEKKDYFWCVRNVFNKVLFR